MRVFGYHFIREADLITAIDMGIEEFTKRVTLPITLRAEASGDLFALIAAVREWADAYQASLDLVAAPSTTEEERKARYLVRERFSKAESALRALARRCTR